MPQLHGNNVDLAGTLVAPGDSISDFVLTDMNLEDTRIADYAGKKVVLNIFPSVDTGTCAASVRRFNKEAASLKNNTVVLCISRDLPFAHKRFCSAEGIENVVSLSSFKSPEFGKALGLEIANSKLQGLHARSVVILNEKGEVEYVQVVPEISQEPDYNSVLAAL